MSDDMRQTLKTNRNDTAVDHVADLCTIAANTESGEVWTVENLEELQRQHGLDDYDEIRGLEFGVLMIIVKDAERGDH